MRLAFMKDGQYLLVFIFSIYTCQDSTHLNNIAYIPKTFFLIAQTPD